MFFSFWRTGNFLVFWVWGFTVWPVPNRFTLPILWDGFRWLVLGAKPGWVPSGLRLHFGNLESSDETAIPMVTTPDFLIMRNLAWSTDQLQKPTSCGGLEFVNFSSLEPSSIRPSTVSLNTANKCRILHTATSLHPSLQFNDVHPSLRNPISVFTSQASPPAPLRYTNYLPITAAHSRRGGGANDLPDLEPVPWIDVHATGELSPRCGAANWAGALSWRPGRGDHGALSVLWRYGDHVFTGQVVTWDDPSWLKMVGKSIKSKTRTSQSWNLNQSLSHCICSFLHCFNNFITAHLSQTNSIPSWISQALKRNKSIEAIAE